MRATDSVEEMRLLVDGLRKALERVGLTWNPQKVLVLGLKYTGNGEVKVFDPLIDRGDGTCLQHLTADDVFKILGITTNWKGDFFQAAADAQAKETTHIERINKSLYPIPAKLLAHKQVVANASQYLFFNAWLQPAIIEEMDLLERKSVRSFFGDTNFPNAVIAAELKLACREWRQQVMHLAGWVRRLGSSDSRVQRAALLVSRDAGRHLGLVRDGRPYTDPRFFDFTEYANPTPEAGLLNTPLRYFSLASTWKVGVWMEDDHLVVSHKGARLSHPQDLLQILSKEAEMEWLTLLERRQSTNPHKALAPPNAISWGTAGMVDKHRSESTMFTGPRSPFSDKEIKILMSLRLLLWPTAFRNSIMSNGTESGVCKCGSVQTATHLLLVPEECTRHSPALRSISKCRHSAGVRDLSLRILEDNVWKVAIMEHVTDPEEQLELIRSAISRARGLRVLNMPSETPDTTTGPQHWKPDGIIGKIVKGRIELLLIDVTFASDDKLIIEDELLQYWETVRPPRAKHWPLNSNFFDDGGNLTTTGLASLPPDLAKKAGTLPIFHPARYAKRYEPLVTALSRDPTIKWSKAPEVLTIAIGVAGWIPDYSRNNLRRLVDKKGLGKVTRALTLTAQIHAVKAWSAFSDDD